MTLVHVILYKSKKWSIVDYMFIMLGLRDSSASSNGKRVWNTISRYILLQLTMAPKIQFIYSNSLISIEFMQSLIVRKVLRIVLKIVFARERAITLVRSPSKNNLKAIVQTQDLHSLTIDPYFLRFELFLYTSSATSLQSIWKSTCYVYSKVTIHLLTQNSPKLRL